MMDPQIYIHTALGLSTIGIYLHAITIATVIGFSITMSVLEFIGIRKKDKSFMMAAKNIAKVILIAFGFGAATGTLVEFGLVQVWNGVLLAIGSFVLLPLYLELIAFILEGGTLVALLYTWGRFRNPWNHWLITLIYTSGALLSGAFITSVNSWMQAPWGVGGLVKLIYPWAPVYGPTVVNVDFLVALKEALVQANLQGQAGSVLVSPVVVDQLIGKYGILLYDPWIALKSPYALHSIIHQLLAASLVGISWVAGGMAYRALKDKRWRKDNFKVFRIVLIIVAVLLLVQGLEGHGQGVVVYEYQPTKFAMIAGLEKSGTDPLVGLSMFGDPNHVFEGFDSLIAKAEDHPDPDLRIAGISVKDIAIKDTLAAKEKLSIVHPMYMVKIGAAGIAAILSLLVISSLVFRRFWERKENLLLYIGFAYAFLMPLIAGLGWAVREIGRKPWTVYGLLYPSELITPVEISPWVATGIIGGLIVGLLLMFVTIYVVLVRPPKFLKLGEKR